MRSAATACLPAAEKPHGPAHSPHAQAQVGDFQCQDATRQPSRNLAGSAANARLMAAATSADGGALGNADHASGQPGDRARQPGWRRSQAVQVGSDRIGPGGQPRGGRRMEIMRPVPTIPA